MIHIEDRRDDYCRDLDPMDYCTRICNFPTKMFCEIACKGNPAGWNQEPIEDVRKRLRKPLTETEKNDKRLVSVIIPIWSRDVEYLDRTVNSVKETACGPIEIITEIDSDSEGHRVLMNRMAKKSNGEFLFRLDCHCKLEPEWDARLKSSCQPNTLITPIIDGLDEETWMGRHKDMGLICLSRNMENSFPIIWKAPDKRNLLEETISIIGCAYMVRKDDFLAKGGCDESLGKWGYAGPEISLRFHLTNGSVYVRTDTVVCHLFRGKKNPFGITGQQYAETGKKLFKKVVDGHEYGLTRPLEWLMEHFAEYFKAGIRTDVKNIRPIPNA
jgi:glycosyltransferase involved in cell wall biosynthesis